MTASLSSIVAMTRAGLPALQARRRELLERAREAPTPPDWASALRGPDLAVIAEVKRRSPSAGVIAAGLDPAALARRYVEGGARSISVLTENAHFGGSLADFNTVRANVRVPLLRKDFLLDPVQLYESRCNGASAVLLIARALGPGELWDLTALARELGLAVLVEVHRPGDLQQAVDLKPDAIGVNSRDLETFQMDSRTAESMLADVPAEILAVAESGLRTRADVERVATRGADAVLVGTALAGSPDPLAAVRSLVGVPRHPRGQ